MLTELPEKTLRIYKTLLKTTGAPAMAIGEQAGIKRTDVYTHLHTLIEAGLVERTHINKKTLFRACDPSQLTRLLERERRKIAAFSTIYRTSQLAGNTPRVRVLEGRQHLEEVYADVQTANSVISWFGVGDAATLLSAIAYPLADHIQTHQTTFKDIIPNDPRAISYAKKMKRLKGRTYSYRVAPTPLENDILVYGNKVLMVRLNEHDFYATLIEDASFADTFRSVFEMSWKSLTRGSKEKQ